MMRALYGDDTALLIKKQGDFYFTTLHIVCLAAKMTRSIAIIRQKHNN